MSDHVSIVVGGDISANGRLYAAGQPISSTSDVATIVSSADIAFANHETPLSFRGQPMEKLTNIRADPAIAVDIGTFGLTVLSVANNHIMDYGPEALMDTIANLQTEGIALVGAGKTLAQAVEPAIINIRGVAVGFLAFTCLVPPDAGATATGPGVAALHIHSSYQTNPYWQAEEPGEPAMVTIRTFADSADQAFAEECVRSTRSEVDFLCVSMHWGYGGQSSGIAEYQRPLGHAMIDAGADLILGNHVHAPQGIERYKGKLIFYSPGTLIGRQSPPDSTGDDLTPALQRVLADMSSEGFLARVEIDRSGAYSAQIIPTSLDAYGLPFVATGEILDRIAARVMAWSAEFDTHVSFQGGELRIVA